jgi:ERCC4-type nuclease
MLIIDSREKEGSKLVKLVEEKARILNIKTEKKWIEIGDYVFDNICFEAKSVEDFIGSVMSKRLWTQMDNMDRHYKNNVVIIYGDLPEAIHNIIKHGKSKLPIASRKIMLTNKFLGAIGRIVLDTDIKPFWVKSESEASLIITAVCKMQPIERDAIRPQVFKRITTDDLRLDILTSVKGVSYKKAKLLIDNFGSVMEIGEQTSFEIQKLEGFGKVLADRIINVLNSENKVKI